MLLLARHGTTHMNQQMLLQGRSDPELSVDGSGQAQKLANYLRTLPVEVLCSSTLRRAVATAELCADQLGLKVELDERFVERDFGPFEGLDRPSLLEARRRAGLGDVDPTQNWEGCAEVESDSAITTRMLAALGRYSALMGSRDRHVVVVCHSGVIKAMIHSHVFASSSAHRTIKVAEGGIARLLMEGPGEFALEGILQQQDLYEDGQEDFHEAKY